MSNIRTGLPPQSQTWATSQNQRLASAEDNIRILTGSVKDLQKRLQLQEKLMAQVSLDRQNTLSGSNYVTGEQLGNQLVVSLKTYCTSSFTIPEGIRSANISFVGSVTGINNYDMATIPVDVVANPFYLLYAEGEEFDVGTEIPIGTQIVGEDVPHGGFFNVTPTAQTQINVSGKVTLIVGYYAVCWADANSGYITNASLQVQTNVAFKREEL